MLFDIFRYSSLENVQLEEPNLGAESSVENYREAENSNRTDPANKANAKQQNSSTNSKAPGEIIA